MVRTRRLTIVSVVSMVFLLSAALGMWLGMVPQQEWDLFLARLRSDQVVSVAPTSRTQATLFVFDEDQPLTQEVMLDVHLSGSDSVSVPVWLATDRGATEMVLDDGLMLRVELVSEPSSSGEPAVPLSDFPPLKAAQR